MRSDRTLKIILTVIAISLVMIVIELATPVNANNSVIDVNIRQVGGSSVFRSIPVQIQK